MGGEKGWGGGRGGGVESEGGRRLRGQVCVCVCCGLAYRGGEHVVDGLQDLAIRNIRQQPHRLQPLSHHWLIDEFESEHVRFSSERARHLLPIAPPRREQAIVIAVESIVRTERSPRCFKRPMPKSAAVSPDGAGGGGTGVGWQWQQGWGGGGTGV